MARAPWDAARSSGEESRATARARPPAAFTAAAPAGERTTPTACRPRRGRRRDHVAADEPVGAGDDDPVRHGVSARPPRPGP